MCNEHTDFVWLKAAARSELACYRKTGRESWLHLSLSHLCMALALYREGVR
jgi:hypothetical protein